MSRSIFVLSCLLFSLTVYVARAQSPNINQVGHAFSWWSRYPCAQECGVSERGSTLENDGASYVFNTNFCGPITNGCNPPPITFISLQSNFYKPLYSSSPEYCGPTGISIPNIGCVTRKEFKFGFLEATSITTPGALITNPINQQYPDLFSGDFVMASRELFPFFAPVGPRYHSKFIISKNGFGNMIFTTTSPENTSPVAHEHYQSKRIEIGAYGDVTIGGARDVYGIPQEWKGLLHVTRRNNSSVINMTPGYTDEHGHGGVCAIVSRFETSTDAPNYARLISLGVGDPNAWMVSRDLSGVPVMTNQLSPREEVFTVWRNGTTIIATPNAPDALTALTPEDGGLLTVKGKTVSAQLAAQQAFYVGTPPSIGFSTTAAGITTTSTLTAKNELVVGVGTPPPFHVNSTGRLSIGGGNTGAHTDYHLSVNGKIVAKEIIVTIKDWPDYVFDENYALMSLNDLESFVKTNKHLPSIPRATDVKNNGISVGDMNELLLKKIEELTLYVIQLKKEMKQLQNENMNKE